MKIKNLYKSFENKIIIDNFNIEIHNNKINCLFGRSGCGKTTLINIIAGILKFDKGDITDKYKNISVIFQDSRLLPWLTIKDNINIVSENKTDYYIDIMELSEFKNYYPDELSGGMKQRVNIARALSYKYNLLIMDEPFKGLDINSKKKIMCIVKNELKGKTSIFITHDIDEAVFLSDNIYILNGPPLNIKDKINIDIPFKKRNNENLNIYKNEIINKINNSIKP